jgi:hypothetical protein
MNSAPQANQLGNVLLCTLATILVVSIIGGSVLLNCTNRFNVSSNQVRGWKEALQAAEAGGDIAYNEIRKTVLDPSNAFLGWTQSGTTYSNSPITLGTNSLATSSVVDIFYYDVFTGNPWYRVRTRGTAPVRGLKRTGMDDRMITGSRGDSILRKIDFNYDHFIATYGPNGDGIGKTLVPVSQPQVTRRIEQIAGAITPFEAAIKCIGTFYGLGDAALIDSYDSRNGPYYFCATHPTDPFFGDSRSGNVEINSAVATIRGWVYGDVATNGGSIVRSQYITGTIDNNVPFNVEKFYLPRMPLPQPSPTTVTSTVTITPPPGSTAAIPAYYVLSSLTGNLTINSAGPQKTYVAIHVTNDVTGSIDIKPNVQLKVFVDGSMDVKGRDIQNESGIASNLQYYAISPANSNTPQHVNINPPGNFAAVFYAPGADLAINGNPDLTGAVVCKTFYANGNVTWHYDRELGQEGDAVDYRIASYVEDIR